MLDIRVVRENPQLIESNLKKRNDFEKIKWLNDLLKKDADFRELLQKAELLRQKRNQLTKEVEKLKREKKPVKKAIEEAKKIPELIKKAEEKAKALKEKVDFYLLRLPNLLHESVPLGKDESDNPVVGSWGQPRKPSFKLKHHGMLAAELGVADFERAVKISGEGFFFLKGDLALMDFAVQRLAIDLLRDKGFTLVQPPFLMRKEPYEGVTELSDFEKVMYKVEGEDLYLIATSEHPIAAMHSKEILSENELPIKLAGVSSCFRREVGKHGLDERGLFRVHQFNKIEQFVFCRPEDSWEIHKELLSNAEELLKKLDIPFNVTNICTGDIGFVAAKKYDVNGWSPREEKFFELMSVSNCTAYQSTRLGIKYRKKNGEKEFVHTLNASGLATTRLFPAILEQFQNKDGSVDVPKALQKYTGFKKIEKK